MSNNDSSVEEIVKEAVRGADIRLLKDLLATHPYLLQLPLDDDENLLLHLAATSRNPAIPAMLIEKKVDVNIQNKDGLTPLHVAAMNGHVSTLRVLLDAGGDPSIVDYEDMTPLDYAEEEGHQECIEILNHIVLKQEEDDDKLEMSVVETFVKMTIDEDYRVHGVDHTTLKDHSVDEGDDTIQDNTICDQESPFGRPFEEEIVHKSIVVTGCYSGGDDGLTSLSSSSTSSYASTPTQLEPPSPSSCHSLTNDELRAKLIELGELPGPINEQTRGVYLKYLDKITCGIQPAGNKGYKGFKYELALCLNGTISVPDLHRRESSLFSQFRVKGQPKEFFNYLLIDPMCLTSLDKTILNDQQDNDEMFQSFVEAVFYIGKGKNSRSFQHLKDAKKKLKKSRKMERILDIWKHGEGILSLHVFSNIAAGEAYNREAAMIECIGLQNLTNVVKGHYHGSIEMCASSERRQLGLYFIHMSYKAFIVDTPQKIYPEDIQSH